ncbi:MAG: KAP family NTPase [Rivicola pingtungensis]|nr:KAP family NTPase [Rivihabitans pingtungensis]
MTMVDHNESVLGDNPTDEDKLGFAEPAAHLADKIARFPADMPMVVGVEGKWGEGKSSFLLMMKKHWREQARLAPTGFWERLRQFFQEKVLRKKPARQIKLVEFDPWWFSGKENLLDKLLKELEGQEPWWRLKLRGLLKDLEKQANTENKWVNGGVNAIALGLASGASTILNPILDWLGGDLLVLIKSWLQDGRATAVLVLALFWVIQLSLKQFIAWLSPSEGFEARKKKLEELLKEDRFQRVVFIDDLDRLPVDELQEMFRVIKSVANFPNVVYVLAYDRKVVSAALDKFHPGRGELFLEKIVQMPVALPVPTPQMKEKAYREIFSSVPAIHEILQKPTDHYSHNGYGWGLICESFINNTRQAKRLRDAINTQYNHDLLIHPLFFLFLEALYLHAANACSTLCQAMCDYKNHPYYKPSINWVKDADQDAEAKEGLKKLQEWIGAQSSKKSFFPIVRKSELECIAFFLGLPTESQRRPFSMMHHEYAMVERADLAELEEKSRACARYLYKKFESKYGIEFMLSEVKNRDQLVEFIDARASMLQQHDCLARELKIYLLSEACLLNGVPKQGVLEKACSLARLIAEVAEELLLQQETHANDAYLHSFQRSFNGLQVYLYRVQSHDERECFDREIEKSSPLFVLHSRIKQKKLDIDSIYDAVLSKYPFSIFEQALSKMEYGDFSCVTILNKLFLHSSHISPHILDNWLSGLPVLEKLNANQRGHLHAWMLSSLAQERENSKLIVHSKLSRLIPSIRDSLQKTQEDGLLAVLDKLVPEAESNP